MPRVDASDVSRLRSLLDQRCKDCGFSRRGVAAYEFGHKIGEGGFGRVYLVTRKSTGEQFACKMIGKRLALPGVSPLKQLQHLDNVIREVSILRRLRGTLNVARLEDTFEDDDNVYIVTEYCSGGELLQAVGKRQYSERTVASFMRAVLRTLAQCHLHKILHRDVKPGNFLLLSEEEDSPVKAIDFGMAVFFDSKELPRTDLGLDGTPWFMAPENLSSKFYPVSDVWAAGVLAYQLLSGYLPFDDTVHPARPSLSFVWKSILNDPLCFSRSCWKSVSQDAKDFVSHLLVRDPLMRPAAKQALQHPWLQGHVSSRYQGTPLDAQVVARIQRFGQTSSFKRGVLDLIASELLRFCLPPAPLLAVAPHGAADDDAYSTFSPRRTSLEMPGSIGTASSIGEESDDGMDHDGWEHAAAAGMTRRTSLSEEREPAGASGRRHASWHGGHLLPGMHGQLPHEYLEFARRLSAKGSFHGRRTLSRLLGPAAGARRELKKAARLMLDTSFHGPSDSLLLAALPEAGAAEPATREARAAVPGHPQVRMRLLPPAQKQEPDANTDAEPKKRPDGGSDAAHSSRSPAAGWGLSAMLQQSSAGAGGPGAAAAAAAAGNGDSIAHPDRGEECGARGGAGGYRSLMAAQGTEAPAGSPAPDALARGRPATPQPAGAAASAQRLLQAGGSPGRGSAGREEGEGSQRGARRLSSMASARSVARLQELLEEGTSAAMGGQDTPWTASWLPRDAVDRIVAREAEMRRLLQDLGFSGGGVQGQQLADSLRSMGFKLLPSDVHSLLQVLHAPSAEAKDAASEHVSASAFLASQMDWRSFQQSHREMWLECLRRAFREADRNGDGSISSADLVEVLRRKLPDSEVDMAVEEAMLEAAAGECGLDFEQFASMMRVDSGDSLASEALEQYDHRIGAAAAATPDHPSAQHLPQTSLHVVME